jgi:hypothetical protein
VIREERDAQFWIDVLSHPALEHARAGHDPATIATVLPRAWPLAAKHGGFLFFPADSFGRAYELHTLFKPEGWGREAFEAARDAFDRSPARPRPSASSRWASSTTRRKARSGSGC